MRQFAVRLLGAALAATAASVLPAFAQPITTPPPGSGLRAEILDAYRPAVEAELGAPVEFVVQALNVMDDWAFVEARPQRPGGNPIDWRRTRYRQAFESDMMSDLVLALLRRRGEHGWQVIENVIGPTDVVWENWLMTYHLPRALFRGP
jgi:hypothetical protein